MKISLSAPEKVPSQWTQTLRRVIAQTDEPLYQGQVVIAIDPGVNFGMTVINDEGLYIYNGKLSKQENSLEYAWQAMGFIRGVLFSYRRAGLFVLEGAAYHKTFGQVGLADVRCGFYLGAREILGGETIRIIAPMSARKMVFGDGKYQASDAFPTLNHNAADSFGLALAALGTRLRTEA